jgi:ornithine cyclodeaminase/alanine dehydrogenase-like protein (mu-crystallin family)
MAAEAGLTEPLRLRVALVGCGRISAYHVAALTALRDVEIVAVCDVDEKSAREGGDAPRHSGLLYRRRGNVPRDATRCGTSADPAG